MSKKPAGNSQGQGGDSTPPKLPAQLEEDLDREIGPLVPKSTREQILARVTRVVTRYESFAGPIPHPKHMREYDDILPGSADRIISMAEKAQSHNQEMERTIVVGNVRANTHGMYLGFAALIILILFGVYAGMNGNNVLAGLLLGTGFVGGAATLIRGWSSNGNGSGNGNSEKQN